MELQQIDHRGLNRVLGRLDQFAELATIVNAITSKALYFQLPDGTHLRTRILAEGNCFAVDHKERRYLEQNRTLLSPEAERARQGAVIVWVLRTSWQGRPLRRAEIIGKIEDGEVRAR